MTTFSVDATPSSPHPPPCRPRSAASRPSRTRARAAHPDCSRRGRAEASGAFRCRDRQWRATQLQVEDSLAAINHALDVAARQYADAEQASLACSADPHCGRRNEDGRLPRRRPSHECLSGAVGLEVHATRRVADRSRVLLGLVGDDGLGGEEQAGDRRGVLQRGAGHLRRVVDALREQVDVLTGRGVEAVTDRAGPRPCSRRRPARGRR